MTKSNWIGMIAVGVTFLGIMVMVVLAYGQTSRDIGALQSDVKHLEQGQKDLSAQIDRRFDDLLVQLRNHGHVDGETVFYSP
jgi:hypothetical protein